MAAIKVSVVFLSGYGTQASLQVRIGNDVPVEREIILEQGIETTLAPSISATLEWVMESREQVPINKCITTPIIVI
jgi:hypothetical protein